MTNTQQIEYDKVDAVNYSKLKYMGVSALEYKYRLTAPKKTTPAMLRGSAFHCAMLTPKTFDFEYVAKSAVSDKKSEVRTILSDDMWHDIKGMVEGIRRVMPPLDTYSAIELPVYWIDPDTGIRCKDRVDAVRSSTGFDEFKSCSSTYLYPDRFCKHYKDMGYHVQAAMYHDGLKANGYEPCPVTCYSVVQSAPYDSIEWDVPHCVIEEGRDIYKGWLYDLKRCIETDTWPGIGKGKRFTIILPQYGTKRAEEERDEQ